jgi:uncharacterized protein (UPF0332 family)
MLTHHYADEAGRLAYGAGLNATRGLIFERTGQVMKTHGGTHSEFSRLVRDDPAFADRHRRFLGRTYALKTVADYGGDGGIEITPATAQEALDMAVDLLTAIESAITGTETREE